MAAVRKATVNSADLGARWIRAALQVNPYSYEGKVRPANRFASEADYNSALLDRCEALGIELVAATDHWRVESASTLIDDAAQRGVACLPGFEANSAEGVHLLVLFERGTELAEVNAAIGVCGGTPGCPNGTAGRPFGEILREMSDRGALVVPAHVNVPNGGLLTGRTGQPLVNMIKDPNLHAIAVCPDIDEERLHTEVLQGTRPFDRQHPLAVLHADDVCDPDVLGRGGSCWFKASTASLAGLKMAVRTPRTRISTDDPTAVRRSVIREVSWVGGFLDGVTVPVSPELTTLIGSRGTGKSTVIESLRFALGLEPTGRQAAVDHAAIVSGVLRSGTTVRVIVDAVQPVPGRFVIERSVPNPPTVRDIAGTSTRQAPEDVLGLVEIYGQHELAELASDKASVARMLERFAGQARTDPAYDATLLDLEQNRLALSQLEGSLADLEANLADIERLEERVQQFEATDVPERLAELEQFERDSATFAEATSRIGRARAAVTTLRDADGVTQLRLPVGDISRSSQPEVLAQVADALSGLAGYLDSLITAAAARVDGAQDEVAAALTSWEEVASPQRDGHAEVLRGLVADGHDPATYLTTTRALEDLRAQLPLRDSAVSKLSGLAQERDRLLGELAAHETRRSEELNAAVRIANARTGGVVVVRPIEAAERSHIKGVIEEHVRGQRNQITAAIDADGFSPRALAAAARSGSTALEKFGIRGAQATALVAAGEDAFRALEELTVAQAVDVQLDVGVGTGSRQFRSIDDLSKGQRATALLLLLLGASDAALVIDQPEDDLDNRFVYDGIVTKLRELKGRRQIIASTHNANVPVLGDAELIIALEGDGNRGWPSEAGIGSLDDASIRALVENLLEGGAEAFSARQHLYGF